LISAITARLPSLGFSGKIAKVRSLSRSSIQVGSARTQLLNLVAFRCENFFEPIHSKRKIGFQAVQPTRFLPLNLRKILTEDNEGSQDFNPRNTPNTRKNLG
jgi:hypothetical protein